MVGNGSSGCEMWLNAINFGFGVKFEKLGFLNPNSVRFQITGLEAELDFAQNMKVVGIDVMEMPVKFQVIWINVE